MYISIQTSRMSENYIITILTNRQQAMYRVAHKSSSSCSTKWFSCILSHVRIQNNFKYAIEFQKNMHMKYLFRLVLFQSFNTIFEYSKKNVNHRSLWFKFSNKKVSSFSIIATEFFEVNFDELFLKNKFGKH